MKYFILVTFLTNIAITSLYSQADFGVYSKDSTDLLIDSLVVQELEIAFADYDFDTMLKDDYDYLRSAYHKILRMIDGSCLSKAETMRCYRYLVFLQTNIISNTERYKVLEQEDKQKKESGYNMLLEETFQNIAQRDRLQNIFDLDRFLWVDDRLKDYTTEISLELIKFNISHQQMLAKPVDFDRYSFVYHDPKISLETYRKVEAFATFFN